MSKLISLTSNVKHLLNGSLENVVPHSNKYMHEINTQQKGLISVKMIQNTSL